jgi:uncharacterized Zn finger protein
MISRRVEDKAVKLLRDGKVGNPTACREYPVEGEHGAYSVFVYPGEPVDEVLCTCPAETVCSHAVAAWTFDAEINARTAERG